MIVSVQDEARLHGEDLRPPCAACGRPVADPLDLVHVACERTARADAMHALLSGPAPAPGRLPARGAAPLARPGRLPASDAPRLLDLIGEPLGVYRLGADGGPDGGIYGGTGNASTDRADVAAFAGRTGAVAVVPADLVCIDVDGKRSVKADNPDPELRERRLAALRAAGIDPDTAAKRSVKIPDPELRERRLAALRAAGIDLDTAVVIVSAGGYGLHLWWRAGDHVWPDGKVAKLTLPGGMAVELYARQGGPGGRCQSWLAASPGYLDAGWTALLDVPAALHRLATRPAPRAPLRRAAGGDRGGAAVRGANPGAATLITKWFGEIDAATPGDGASGRHGTIMAAAGCFARLDLAGRLPAEVWARLRAHPAARAVADERGAGEVEAMIRAAHGYAAKSGPLNDRPLLAARRRKADPTRAELRRRLRQAPGLSVRIWAEAGPAQGTPGESHGARWLPGDAARRVVPGALPPDVHGLAVTGGPNGVTLLAVHPDGQLDGRYRRRWENQP